MDSETPKKEMPDIDSISKFEAGVKISKKCNDLLKNAELRIKKVIKENGEIKEEDFKV